jgi:hypothetical protein
MNQNNKNDEKANKGDYEAGFEDLLNQGRVS